MRAFFIKIIKSLFPKLFLEAETEQSFEKSVELNTSIRYIKKKLMTDYEIYFYQILKQLEDEFALKVHPQLNLASVVDKLDENYFRNELFRNIDFAIFSNDYKELKLVIEINDSTHKSNKRVKRDLKVKEICRKANINLITFYSLYPNKPDYVKNRVKKELGLLTDEEISILKI